MEIQDAKEMLESTVSAMLKDTSMGIGSGSVYDAAEELINNMPIHTFMELFAAIRVLQSSGMVLYKLPTGPVDRFEGRDTIIEFIRELVEILLIQEAQKALRLSPRLDGSPKMGQSA